MLYNELRNIMANTGEVWLWGWLGYLFTTTTLALGYSQGAQGSEGGVGEGEETKERDSGKARKIAEQHNKAERERNKYSTTAELDLSAKERRLIEQDTKIAQLQSELLNYISKQHETGQVDRLPNTNELIFNLSDGVTSKLLTTDEVKTIYYTEFEEGSFIPEHNHVQEELIQVLEGRLIIDLTDDKGELTDRKTLKRGDSFLIKPYINHVAHTNKGANTIITFEPPMIKLEDGQD